MITVTSMITSEVVSFIIRNRLSFSVTYLTLEIRTTKCYKPDNVNIFDQTWKILGQVRFYIKLWWILIYQKKTFCFFYTFCTQDCNNMEDAVSFLGRGIQCPCSTFLSHRVPVCDGWGQSQVRALCITCTNTAVSFPPYCFNSLLIPLFVFIRNVRIISNSYALMLIRVSKLCMLCKLVL